MPPELYPHQREAIEKLSNGNILWGGVGTGKTITALMYYLEKEPDKDLLIITTAKKRDSGDWQNEAASLGITELIVDSWQNVGKYEGITNVLAIWDEQRVVGSGAWVKSFLKIVKNNRWILLSATPGDTWLDYIPVFLGNNFYKNRTEFLREHVVFQPYSKYPKVLRYTGESRLNKYKNQLLVEMPYEMHTTRASKNILVAHDEVLLKKVVKDRWHVYEERPLRDVAELFLVMRKVVNSSPARLAAVKDLMQIHPKLIVFYNFNYELESLRSLASSTSIAEWNGHKHEEIPDTDSWVYLVQYQAGAEGWNCIDTDAMVFYSLTYSYKLFHQAHGSIDRLNTAFLNLKYYTLISDSMIDKAISKALGVRKILMKKTPAKTPVSLELFEEKWSKTGQKQAKKGYKRDKTDIFCAILCSGKNI